MASRKELQALITLSGKVSPSLKAALQSVQKNTAKTSKSSVSAISAIGGSFKSVAGTILKSIGPLVGVTGIAMIGKNAIQLASDLQEVQNVVDVTFGSSGSDQINKWSKEALKAYGLTELAAKQYTGTMGAMLKSSGLSGDNIIAMSEKLSALSGDFASFYNLDNETAFEKIRSGISGETEPLKQLGINMSVANLEAYALSKGIKTSYQKMDQASQVALRYSYLMNVSKDAQGDFARTQGSFANQTKLLKSNWDQFTATLASKVLPKFTELIQKANTFISDIASSPEKMKKLEDGISMITGGIEKMLKFATDAYNFIKNNWSWIEPIIWGIAGATVAWNVALKAAMVIEALSKAWKVGSAVLMMFQSGASLATIAQWALNLAMSANPIALIVIAVAVLIGALVLLYKNWDKVSSFLVGVWQNNVMPFFGSIGEWFAGIWDGVIGILKGGANTFIDIFNFLIRGLNKIQFDVPDWVPLLGGKHIGINIPEIQKFAQGGFANRPAIFGEAGPEAAIPIKYKNPRSLALLNRTAKAIGADPGSERPGLTFNFNFSGPISKPEDVKTGVAMTKDYIYGIMDDYYDDRGRPAFG